MSIQSTTSDPNSIGFFIEFRAAQFMDEIEAIVDEAARDLGLNLTRLHLMRGQRHRHERVRRERQRARAAQGAEMSDD